MTKEAIFSFCSSLWLNSEPVCIETVSYTHRLWSVLYNANPNTGLINSILVSLGMSPIKCLSDASTAMNSIIFMSAWQGAGYQMMIFLAGLQGIPRDQYEAASVDGATKFKQFLYITIPGLKRCV